MFSFRDWIDPAIGIAGIVIVAYLLRWIAHRLISRLTDGVAGGKLPTLLRPLSNKAGVSGNSERRIQRARTVGSLLRSVASFVIYGVAFVLVLSKLGINIAPIIASAGVVGVAVGFGAQNLIKDFLSGIFMMLEDQYGVGDIVDLGDASGTVEMVGLRITTVRDVNGTVWYVRNGTISAVGNSTQRFGVAVVDMPLGFSADVDRAADIANETARQAVAKAPLSNDILEEIQILGAQDLSHTGITLRLTVKTKPGRQWAVKRALTADVKMALDTAGLSPTVTTISTGS